MLPLLNNLKLIKSDHWLATCPAHNDTNPSLAITELPDGRVLLNCWSGCTAKEVVNALRLTLRVLYPQPDNPSQSQAMSVWERHRLRKKLRFEELVIAIYEAQVKKSIPFSNSDLLRVCTAFLNVNELQKKLVGVTA